MESKDLAEPDVPVANIPADDAPAPEEMLRSSWKTPWLWPREIVFGIKSGPRQSLRLQECRDWPKRLIVSSWRNKLTVAVVFSSGIAIILPVLLYFVVKNVRHQRGIGVPVKSEQIIDALQRGDYAETKILARRWMAQRNLKTEDAGIAPFALGAVAVFEAEKMKGKNRQVQYLLASQLLEEADGCGFPEDHRAEGLYLCGKSLYEIGQFAKCRPILLRAMRVAPRHKSEIYMLLANAFLNDTDCDLTQAMEQNSLFLSDKNLSATDRRQGLLQKARLQRRMDRLGECRATLKEIPEDSSESVAAMVVLAQVMMREAQLLQGKTAPSPEANQLSAREKYQEAVKTLRGAESRVKADSEIAREAMYLVGVCFMESDDLRAANDQFTRTHKLYPESPEGTASSLQQAELSRRAGRDMEMLSEYRRVLGGFEHSTPYQNPWISAAELKSRLSSAFQEYLGKQQFEICLQLVGLTRPLVPAEQSRLVEADLHAKWAQSLTNSAEKASRNKREPMRRLAREQFRRAGQDYAVLAKMYSNTRQYPDQIWNAANAYLQGHNFHRAVALFHEYLQNEVHRRRPQALEALGESLISLGQYDAALETLTECIDLYPRDAAACHARLLAAQASREKGDLAAAEKSLLANLNGDYLTPASKEWRESLFLLGELLHDSGRYTDAIRRLDEAVRRYADQSESVQGRYLLADCYCRLACAMQEDLKKDVSGNSNEPQSKIVRNNFESALEQYRAIQEKLGGDRDLAELSTLDKEMLRNSYFSIGEVLFAEGEYQGALKAYYSAANRCQNRPEVLDAYVQIANIYRRLGEPQDAVNALKQAQLILKRMKPEVSFAETSIYTREQWSKRLEELQRTKG